MTLLPLIQRELLVRARGRGSRRLRLGVALAGMLICLPQLVSTSPFTTPSTVGRQIFSGLASAAFILCCAGCLLTADAVGSERREGTLGLLFLTRVKAPDILLGKLGSNGLDALCALAALLPLLVLPVLLGGVTGGEATRKGLALVNALCLALAAGLCESASYRKRFRAEAEAVVLVLVIVLLPATRVWFWAWATFSLWLPGFPMPSSGLGAFLHGLSPLSAMIYADDLPYRASGSAYWVSLAVVQAMVWLLLAGGSLRLRRAVVEAGNPDIASARGVARYRARGARPILRNGNPVEWLVRRQPGLRAAIWTAALATVIFQMGGIFLFRSAPAFSTLGAIANGLPQSAVHFLCWALCAWAASRYFVGVRRTGELELLLATPLGAEQIAQGQWRALKGLLLGPVLLMALAIFPGLLLRDRLMGMGSFTMAPWWQPDTLIPFVLGIADMALGLAALCWLGLWFGLKSASQAGAIIRTLALGQAVPYAISIFVLGLYWPLPSLFPSMVFAPIAYLWTVWLPYLVVLLYYAWMIRWARRRLRREFSEAEPGSFSLPRRPASGSADFPQAGPGGDDATRLGRNQDVERVEHGAWRARCRGVDGDVQAGSEGR